MSFLSSQIKLALVSACSWWKHSIVFSFQAYNQKKLSFCCPRRPSIDTLLAKKIVSWNTFSVKKLFLCKKLSRNLQEKFLSHKKLSILIMGCLARFCMKTAFASNMILPARKNFSHLGCFLSLSLCLFCLS